MSHVLNSQSDGIVVVKAIAKAASPASGAVEEIDEPLKLEFCNSKSIEMFDINFEKNQEMVNDIES